MEIPTRIAVLGFGSLPNQIYSDVYNKTLQVVKPNISSTAISGSNLKPNSPFIPADNLKLPVRLGRLSGANTDKRRITMTLHPQASNEPVFVAQSKFNNLNDAIRNLREREGIPEHKYENIGYVNLATNTSRSRVPGLADKIKQWAEAKGFSSVVWTDLPPNIDFAAKSGGREIEALLARDPVLQLNTQKYIENLAGPRNELQKRILNPSLPCSEKVAPASNNYRASLTADFDERAKPENQTHASKNTWYTSTAQWDWGPFAAEYPAPKVPQGVNPVEWKRDRVIEAAQYWIGKGVPYSSATSHRFNLPLPGHVEPSFGLRGHFPARNCGLDCSNFVSWVYNFGLGRQFSSAVDDQINHGAHSVGRKLDQSEALKKGDLLYYNGNVRHVAIYMDPTHVIESTSSGQGVARVVDISKPQYAYLKPNSSNPKFLFARRAIE